MASNFVKTLTNMLTNFSLELVNIGQPKSALIANQNISFSYDATSIFDGISRASLKI